MKKIQILVKMSVEDRLNFIALTNPELAVQYLILSEDFPELKEFISVAPNDVNINDDPTNTIFETVVYYVANVGVRVDYANKQFEILKTYIQNNTWEQICYYLDWLFTNYSIQPKKQDIYRNIILFMNNNGYNKDNLTIEFAIYMKNHIKGLGDGYLGYIKNKYTSDDNCIQHTDMYFVRGFQKVYGTDNKTFIKNKCNEILKKGHGRIFNGLMFNIAHYYKK